MLSGANLGPGAEAPGDTGDGRSCPVPRWGRSRPRGAGGPGRISTGWRTRSAAIAAEALGLALGPAIFEHHVPAFHMTELAQAIREGHDDVGARRWASWVISSPTRRAVPGVWA